MTVIGWWKSSQMVGSLGQQLPPPPSAKEATEQEAKDEGKDA